MSRASSYMLACRLTQDERDRLFEFAEARGRMAVSAVIRQALIEYLDRHRAENTNERGAEVVDAQATAL